MMKTKTKITIFLGVYFVYLFLLNYDRFLNMTISNSKVLCVIMTPEKSFISRGLTSFNSWGRKCYKTVFACNCEKIKKIFESNKYENILQGLSANNPTNC